MATKKNKAKNSKPAARKKSKAESSTRKKRTSKPSLLKLMQPVLVFFFAILVLGALLWVALLDFEVREKFEGKRWAIPAKVYSRALEIYVGMQILPTDFLSELKRLHYKEVSQLQTTPGTYSYKVLTPRQTRFEIFTRGFEFSDGEQTPQKISIEINNDTLIASNKALARLEPHLIGGIYPSHNEDRVLIQLQDTPQYLIETLVLVEDREFFNHFGISPKAILRAALVNIFSGSVRQGGSTLTQQLVKNFYLTNERTLVRKINEAMMSLLLEAHYSKNEILEAYLNEVNLGQVGKRGIHGFGLAAQHYFGMDLRHLELHQVALLVALVKGPSFYAPRRNPDRALERRNLVLDLMVDNGFITKAEGEYYKAKDLSLTESSFLKYRQYPAFLDLVKRQLQKDYSAQDLQSEGLRIFTTLDPVLQAKAESSVSETIGRLRTQAVPDLQGAFVVIEPQSAEVKALVAGADIASAGFNRVLDAQRSIGSLVKPVVYLSALKTRQYNWASQISDSEIFVDKNGNIESDVDVGIENTELWAPKNFDKQVHGIDGKVSLWEAMSFSYNQASVRLGLQVGLNVVIDQFKDLGLQEKPKAYPSLLLGSIETSPFEVTQIYQAIASGGFNTPLRAIREVQDASGVTLNRYPFEVKQVLESKHAYLIHAGLQNVVRQGTARSVNRYIDPAMGLAGKTGTSDQQRDSWFVGYGENLLATAWVGNDDNTVTPYTGSTAALLIWTHFAINYPLEARVDTVPEGLRWEWIDFNSQLLSAKVCENALYVPMLIETIPQQSSECAGKKKTLKRILGF